MLIMSATTAYRQLRDNVRAGMIHMPSKSHVGQYLDGGVFPPIKPSFKFQPGSTIFTIGSCFAREVEMVLLDCGFDVPVAGFAIPDGELTLPGPHLLNEYNAGTMVQRLEAVAGLFDHGDKGIEITPNGAIDMFVHVGSKPVTIERLHARRREIDALYRKVLDADVVVMTLGLVECWYDTIDGCYLNRAPSQALVRAEPDRFQFHRMDVEDVEQRIGRAIEVLVDRGLKHLILTVSPVPVEATFMPDGLVIANSYSKAVLRVCAETLSKRFEQVTYFPSFEIVNSFGTKGFGEDNVHVENWVVHHIMHYMLANFLDKSAEPVAQLV